MTGLVAAARNGRKGGEMRRLDAANALLAKADASFEVTTPVGAHEPLRTGVDLGTASIIVTVLNHNGDPVASEMRRCEVARDGLVVDYMGAIEITRDLRNRLEARLGRELAGTAIALPPGTGQADGGTHRHVVEAAGFEFAGVLDEPTAANAVLRVVNGGVVDIGGGTTGLSVFEDGREVYVADEATGGTHMSLVLMGRYGITFDEAEAMKQDPARQADVAAAVLPVMEKMAGIVRGHIAGHAVRELWLVGGTSSLPGIDDVFRRVTGIDTVKPSHPMLVTPLGIAMNCGTP
jgi:ethanolamine utilization protein EutJ